jgi:hypothetical protein
MLSEPQQSVDMARIQFKEWGQPCNDVIGKGRSTPLLNPAQVCLVDPHVQRQRLLAVRALAAQALQCGRELKNLLQAHDQHLASIESNIGFALMLRRGSVQINR